MANLSEATTTPVVNTCCNSLAKKYKVWGIERQVYNAIEDSNVELKPSEIARIIHSDKKPKEITSGQYTTVRVACRKLLDKDLIVQPYDGAYCNKITYGVRFVPLCVHNIRLLAEVCRKLEHWEVKEHVGNVKIYVCFGKERRKISGFIACDVRGMTHDACLLALNRWFDIVEGRLGYCLQDIVLQSVEFNKDYAGRRLDGYQCVTKKELYGIIDRTYQKEEDVIRRERKLTQPMSLNKFEAELHRQLEDIGKGQELFELKEDVCKLAEAIKYSNGVQLGQSKLLEAMYDAIRRSNGNLAIENLESVIKDFTNASKELTGALQEVLGVLKPVEAQSHPSSNLEEEFKGYVA